MADYTFDDEGNPVKRIIESYNDQFAEEEDVTQIFDVKGDGFDVTLSLASGTLQWNTVNPSKGIGAMVLLVCIIQLKNQINLVLNQHNQIVRRYRVLRSAPTGDKFEFFPLPCASQY